ncbi:MAG: glycosyltransferase family 39 protein [Candidatus Krumholzibacteria bacterium]|nr:glycosyltransferase family 39 protein [Candidatus Krumholzibacteria bacterium]
MSPKRALLVFLLILVIYPLGLAAISQVRPLDGDEGYYASAARLVSEGRTPYEDFFYPQMPLLPYVYAPFYKMVGSSLASMRLLSVFLSSLALVLWGLFLRARFGDRPMFVVGGLLLVAMNPYLLSWNVTVKTYALSNLGVFAALWAVDRGFQSRRAVWFLVAGLAAGFVVEARLLYLPWAGSLLVALAWIRWRHPGAGVSHSSVAATGVGFLLGLVPAFRLYIADPARFRFNNLDYHNLRFSPLDRAGGDEVPQLAAAFLELGRSLFLNPYMVVLILLAVVGWVTVRRSLDSRDRDLQPVVLVAGVGAVVHTVACLFPDPVHGQYFTSPLAPMLAPLALLGVVDLARRFGRPTTLVTAVVVLCCVLSFVDLQVRRTGINWDEVWDFEHLNEVSANIEARTEPGDMVLAFWSGYVFETGRRFVPGMENHFALGVSEKLPLNRQIEDHIAGKELLLKAILTKAPTVVVLGGWMHEVNTTLEQKDIPLLLQELDNNYEIAWMKGEVKVMVRRPGPGLNI